MSEPYIDTTQIPPTAPVEPQAEPFIAHPAQPQSSSYSSFNSVSRGGLWFGIALIVAGGFFLFNRVLSLSPELHAFFGDVSFWQWWPLLVIIGGITTALSPKPGEHSLTVNRFFEGLFSLAIGLVLLACSLGWLSWNFWLACLALWPLLLVLAGTSLLARALHAPWLHALSSLLCIVAFLALAVSWWRAPLPLPDFLTDLSRFLTPFTQPGTLWYR